MLRKIAAWLWGLLPDECEAHDCTRQGVRGNENVVRIGVRTVVLCDYCHARFKHEPEVITLGKKDKAHG